jgi:hypothetical protein
MRFVAFRKPAAAAFCSCALAGFLFAAGCSEQKASGDKLNDPEHKANMEKITEQFKTKMQERKNKSKASRPAAPGHS